MVDSRSTKSNPSNNNNNNNNNNQKKNTKQQQQQQKKNGNETTIHPTNRDDDDDDPHYADLLSTEWLGFALTLKKAIETHVTTPLVWVTPHDYELETEAFQNSSSSSKDFLLEELVRILLLDNTNDNDIHDSTQHSNDDDHHCHINYVGLPNAKTLTFSKRHAKTMEGLGPITIVTSSSSASISSPSISSQPIDKVQQQQQQQHTFTLEPLGLWKENPHLATVKAYKNFVFAGGSGGGGEKRMDRESCSTNHRSTIDEEVTITTPTTATTTGNDFKEDRNNLAAAPQHYSSLSSSTTTKENRLLGVHHHKFKRGHFIEDTLGQQMLQTLKMTPTIQEKIYLFQTYFGTYLLQSDIPCTYHMNGLNYMDKMMMINNNLDNDEEKEKEKNHNSVKEGYGHDHDQPKNHRHHVRYSSTKEFEMIRARAAAEFVQEMNHHHAIQ